MAAIKKRRITLWVVALLALLGWWLQRQEGQVPLPVTEERAEVMDYALTDFVIIAMDETGAPKHRLRGQSMSHYAESDYAELVEPRLEVYGRGGDGTTSVDAPLARVYQGGESVLLEGDVRMLRQDAGEQAGMEVQTRDLWFFAEREFAETGAAVTITEAKGVTTAEGMTMDLKTGILHLLAAVRGRYEID